MECSPRFTAVLSASRGYVNVTRPARGEEYAVFDSQHPRLLSNKGNVYVGF